MFTQNISGFDWDEGNLSKCQKHGVSIDAIESVFHGDMVVSPDPAHSQYEERFIGIGKTDQGRYVFIAFTLRHRDSMVFVRPISVRYMHTKEVKHYEKEIAHINK
jgi:uncharacterized protein